MAPVVKKINACHKFSGSSSFWRAHSSLIMRRRGTSIPSEWLASWNSNSSEASPKLREVDELNSVCAPYPAGPPWV